MRPLLTIAILFVPTLLAAQEYKESVFIPGLDSKDATPLTEKQKLEIRTWRIIRPESLLFDGISAGLNEWKNDPGSWGRDADGAAKRFGSAFGRSGVREMTGFGLDAVLHTDPRIYRSSSTHFKGRLFDALSQVVVTHTDSGSRVPAIATVGSAFISGQIQTIWMPANDAHVKDGLVSAGVMLMGDAARNVIREFWPDIHRKLHHGGDYNDRP
jgi:hypothetical protein